ncbi:hypothetical protein A2707_05210 [Candidatus Saccharibacteria bacterium RIFCSPHIGHO2_01_FULL_45_15]|nr:MAG: hypothetical protein A2707_05210 [Candidatus Saccharibacteria bacterium RIFCSPHIGHO2_01_FULL_45_15]OGL27420.1 MAG: hypothetical protein A3C39_05280 [Candidatus Saccharibacteria bacterium RIFCSPHIGHO2_02_FULL_46_12]OGL32637.1 MAG: hypothetical protein A3E76_04755 [Candidatus Saccharibacteria bacterium RIFCSPHIGHO2_12_FULL_44_22]
MKKLPRLKRKKQADQKPARITNETVAEHRERILAGGRRFKYPVQYARHRLVFNTILISIGALVLIVLFVWWQLYPQQNSSTFFYRITKVVPLPVAVVDGESVAYSNYLVAYRSQIHYLQVKEGLNTDNADSKKQLEYQQRRSIDNAISDAYAAKVAREQNISITTKQVDDALNQQRQSRDGVASKETYDATTLDLFNLNSQEVRGITERQLLKQEVAYKIDSLATAQRDKVVAALAADKDKDFDKAAAAIESDGASKILSGVEPFVPRTNRDGGRAATAAKLQKGEMSQPFKSTTGDGYYIVKLLDVDNDSRVSYAYIKISLTAFDSKVKQLHAQGKIKEYITIPEIQAQSIPSQ